MKTYEGCDGASRVLQAAEKLFAEHGYDGVSASMIAEAASVSKANIFHHFHSKEQLYVEVMKHISGTLMTELESRTMQTLLLVRASSLLSKRICVF